MVPSEMNLRDMNKCHSSLMYPAATWLLLSKTPWFLVRLYLAKSKPKSKLVLVFTCVITALATCLMVMPIDLIKLLDCQNAFGHALPWIPSLIRFTFSMYWNMEGNQLFAQAKLCPFFWFGETRGLSCNLNSRVLPSHTCIYAAQENWKMSVLDRWQPHISELRITLSYFGHFKRWNGSAVFNLFLKWSFLYLLWNKFFYILFCYQR